MVKVLYIFYIRHGSHHSFCIGFSIALYIWKQEIYRQLSFIKSGLHFHLWLNKKKNSA